MRVMFTGQLKTEEQTEHLIKVGNNIMKLKVTSQSVPEYPRPTIIDSYRVADLDLINEEESSVLISVESEGIILINGLSSLSKSKSPLAV